MSNQKITNKLGSVLTLAPLLDDYGHALVLQPKGAKGDTKEISAETAAHEIISRVKKANWVSLSPAGAAPAASPPSPAPSKPAPAAPPLPPTPSKPVVAAPPPPPPPPVPVVEPVSTPVSAPVPEETVQTTTVTTVETTTVTTDVTPPAAVEPPAKVTRAPRK
jgi:hypothetical protein